MGEYYTFKYRCEFYPLPGLDENFRLYKSKGYGKIVNPTTIFKEDDDIKQVIKQRMIDGLNRIINCFIKENVPEVILFTSESNERIQSMQETYQRMCPIYKEDNPISCIIIISQILSSDTLINEDDGANYKLIIDDFYNGGCDGDLFDNLYELYAEHRMVEKGVREGNKILNTVCIIFVIILITAMYIDKQKRINSEIQVDN